ncbi:hypothetical protein Mal15_02030 [Stieleria maiorica]|uniref:Uncharacterized protein n=1 Tax=Stieleria maiorica TaxID=2795974 RepID=A0A5B9M7Q2_9BACT|nr:redoxin domain-containing protein [Stieleria maiorica]QEF96176.1 hypothetical protein Mal15_02030 [Stieleria maiorica]
MVRLIKSVLTIVVGTILLIPIALAALKATGNLPRPLVDRAINQLPIDLTSAVGLRSADPVVLGDWPPVRGNEFPDLVLTDQTGQTVQLSDFAGKVILVEYAAIPCEGCQAFSGGKQHGAFGSFRVQPGLESIEHYAQEYAGVTLGSEDVVFVQVLLYGKSVSAPTQAEVADWAEHFQLDRDANQIVLRGDPSMLSQKTYEMIPGFHLIDRDFVLRSDSCGHHPQDDLYKDLLPMLRTLAR